MEPDCCFFIIGATNFENKNTPSRLISRQSFHSSILMFSIKEVGPLMPAFAQRTSTPCHFSLISSNSFKIDFSSRTSKMDLFQLFEHLSIASPSLSIIQILSPFFSNASAIALPIPEAPAVIKTFLDIY